MTVIVLRPFLGTTSIVNSALPSAPLYMYIKAMAYNSWSTLSDVHANMAPCVHSVPCSSSLSCVQDTHSLNGTITVRN